MENVMKIKMSEYATKPLFETSNWFSDDFSGSTNIQSVSADLFCSKCAKTKTYCGKAISKAELMYIYRVNMEENPSSYSSLFELDDPVDYEIEDILREECVFEAGEIFIVQLKCPVCGDKVFYCYRIESRQKKKSSNARGISYIIEYRIQKIGEYPNQESNRLQFLSKYIAEFPVEHSYLVKAEKSFSAGLGVGSVIYLRKAYEVLLYKILDDHGSKRPQQFRQTLERADEVAGIVPFELKNRAYGLFGEMSDIVHGDTNDDVGLEKYENLRDVFKIILDSIIEKKKQAELVARIKGDNAPRGGGVLT